MSSNDPCRYGLDDLLHFGMIAEAGGIASASRRHGVPKTSLSRAVARLEDASGLALFDRIGRGLSLTPFGERLVARAEDARRVSRETERTLLAEPGEPHGPLRIGSNVHTNLVMAAPAIARLQRRWPGVTASLRLVSGEPRPFDDDLDVVLTLGRPVDTSLVSRRVLSLERRLYAAPSLCDASHVDDKDVVACLPRVIVDGADRSDGWTLAGPDGAVLRIDGPVAATAQDASVVLGIVRNGFGMALLSHLFVEANDDGTGLVRLLPGFACHEMEVYASFPPRRTEIPAVRAFVDLLVEHAGEVATRTPMAPASAA